MRLVNVTYKIYEFSELSEDVKTKVKEWYLNNFYQNEEFSDMCKEELSHRFPKSDLKVQYSLSYCQGDGLNVYITLPQNYRYAYCMVDRIDLAEEWEYILTEITPPFKNLNKKLMKRFQQYIVDLFTKFCAELEAAGYQFFYSIDDESMENVCKINEWEFLEDGTLFK